jgi:Amt family ammonium transporter
VFGLHGVAGFIGTVATGVFQTGTRGSLEQTLIQAGGAVAVAVYVAFATFIIAALLRGTIGLRVAEQAEKQGLDLAQHGESLSH